MNSKLVLMLLHPVQAAALTCAFLVRAFLVIISRILLPGSPRYQALRVELQRAYLTSTTLNFPDLTHRLPANYPEDVAQPVEGPEWKGYLVPSGAGSEDILRTASANERIRIVLYAHGGGYAKGVARMCVPYMQRWIAEAEAMGLRLCFLSVEYSLSTQAKHPRQRDEFLAAYKYLLNHGVPATQITFMGDSAGGGICVNAGLYALRTKLPQPAGSILISPWTDMACEAFDGGSPTVNSDYFVQANEAVPLLAKMFRGNFAAQDPLVNPLFADSSDLRGLNSQLIFAGAAEFALSDSKRWARLCTEAHVDHRLHVEPGQLHIWAMGSNWIEPELRRRTDERILTWISRTR